jgi:Flp pilus assembly protein TadD
VPPKRQRRSKAAPPYSPPEIERSSIHTALFYAGLVAINLIAYASVRHFQFVEYDDSDYLFGNPNIAHGLSWESVRWALTTGHAANWHPLTWLSHMLDVQLFGMNPGPHHVVNVVLHTVSTLLLFGVLRRMTGAVYRSAFVAALFAVHPLHVESVAWASERKDVLSTVLFMLALWAYLAYVQRPEWRRYAAVAACLALGLMAKPMLVTLPALLLLLDFWPLRRPLTVSLVKEKIPLLAFAAVSTLITIQVQKHGGAVMRLDQVPFGLRMANVPIAYVHYIAKMFWPVDLIAMNPLPREPAVAKSLGALVILAAISVAIARLGRTRPYLIVGWLWYLVGLLPVIGILQVGAQANADRYTYVPLVGLFVIVAWGVSEIVGSSWVRVLGLRVASLALVAICTLLSFRQSQYWRNSVALWQHAIDVTPDNYFAEFSFGYLLWKQDSLSAAVTHFEKSIRLRPDFSETHNNLGVALARQGKLAEAVPHFEEALRLKPDYVDAQANLKATRAHMKTLDPELAKYASEVTRRPNDLKAHNEFGAALAARGRVDDAIQQFTEALRIDSTQADVRYNLGMMFLSKGRAADARAAFEAALRHNPNHQAARDALKDPALRTTSSPK